MKTDRYDEACEPLWDELEQLNDVERDIALAFKVIGTPNPVNGQHLHDEACEPLWDELEQLNVPIGFIQPAPRR